MPCAWSIPFPTAAIMRYDIGNSHPANILWKKLIAAKYPLTVDCRLLCTKHRDDITPSRSDNTSLGSASLCNHGSFPCACLSFAQVFHFARCFCAYTSRLNRARACQLIVLPRPCALPCCPPFLQGRVQTVNTVEANRGHNNGACRMLIEGHTPLCMRVSRVVRRSLCPTGNSCA